MMLSRPVASGAMLLLLAGAVGGAALQGDAAPEAAVVEISEAEAETPEADTAEAEIDEAEPARVAQATEAPATVGEPEDGEPVERAATAPNRVVESAGFPVVPEAEREQAGPVVTVNGRPLGSSAPAETEAEAPQDEAGDDEPATDVQADSQETQVAVVEPPLPKPRPADLPVQRAEPAMDYEAIAEAAYGGYEPDAAAPQDRQTLAPMPGVSDFTARTQYDRQGDELVGVVGPNGEIIWVYEEQVRGMNSGVNVQRRQQVNPFGFVYD